MSIHHDTPAPTLEEIWGLFRETDRLMKQYALEAERRSQEPALSRWHKFVVE